MRAVLTATIAVSLAGSLASGSSNMPGETASTSQHLFYSASWNALPVARAELTIEPATTVGDGAVRLAGHAETMPLLDLLWRMRDSFEATVATAPLGPQRFVLRQYENRRRRETSVVRDGSARRLVGAKQRPGKLTRSATTPLHGRLHDPASLAYLIRSLPAELDRPQTFDVFTGTKTYRLTVRSAGEDTITALGRSWRARRLTLALALAPVDERTPSAPVKVQTAEVWISTDAERLPLRLTGRTYWGWVTIQLIARRPPQTTTTG